MKERDRRLHQTISHLYANAPGFQRRMAKAGLTPDDIKAERDLARLPVLRKDDLLALQQADPPFGGMLACQPGQLKRIFQSPGPLNEPEPRVDDYWRWEQALRAAGFEAGDIVINALAYHLTPAAAMAEEGLWAIGCAVIPGGIGNQEQQLTLMRAVGANAYFGLPSYLKALLDKADELGIEVAVEKAFVFAEPLPPSLREELSGRGVNVFQGYGTAECGNLGYEVPGRAGWRIPDDVIVQICDINSGQPLPHGETGEVVATLLDEHYALIRFGVGDLSSIVADDDDPALYLKGWLGRVGAATKVRGMFLHPTQLANLMGRFDEVAAYQAVVTRSDHRDNLALEIVVADSAETTTLPDRIARAARDALKFRLAVDIVAALPDDAPPIRDDRTWE